jgi:hypothetical protein
MKWCKDSFDAAFSFLFFCGILGLLTLPYFIIFDRAAFVTHSWYNYLSAIGTGTFMSMGTALLNIACHIGIAGISVSINHS